MRHRLIPAALAAGASLALLAGTAMAATPTWTVVPSVNPSATTLNAVSARTATDAWAVGQFPGAGEDAGSQIFAERWNGTQWQQVPTTNIVRQDERLLGVIRNQVNWPHPSGVSVQRGCGSSKGQIDWECLRTAQPWACPHPHQIVRQRRCVGASNSLPAVPAVTTGVG